MSNFVEKWKAFCEWQRRPSRIPQMAEEHHRCYTCGKEFQGNYCPCCGQSSKIGRYSFKKVFLLFLDVWGMGNRGMFRTLRDLILRPGYLIRDYVSGMQMAYFSTIQAAVPVDGTLAGRPIRSQSEGRKLFCIPL